MLEELPNDITLLVNNAGYVKLEHFLEVTEEGYDKWVQMFMFFLFSL